VHQIGTKINGHGKQLFGIGGKKIPVFLFQLRHFVLPGQVRDADALTVAFHGIRDPNAAARSADRLLPRRVPLLVNLDIPGQHNVGPVGNKNPPLGIYPPVLKHFDLAEQRLRINHHTGPENRNFVRIKNPRRDQVQGVFLPADHDSMPRVGTARVTHNYLRLICQIINDFAFPLITPLGADNHNFQ